MCTHLGGGYEFEATMWQSMIQRLFLADLGLIKVAIKDPNRLNVMVCGLITGCFQPPAPTTTIH